MKRFLAVSGKWIFFLALVSLLAVVLFRYRYFGMIRTLAQTQVKNATSDLINRAVDRQIAAGNIQYDRIVFFEKDINGRITALKTNMSEINRLKTEVLSLINEEILALDSSDIGIPLGSLLFPEFFAGRGPEIPVQILSIRNSDAAFSGSFTQAGINQTLHKINMSVTVDVSILVLGKTASFSTTTQVVVAETVIVGQVPDTYLNTGGNYGS